jgi:hypothetical protein
MLGGIWTCCEPMGEPSSNRSSMSLFWRTMACIVDETAVRAETAASERAAPSSSADVVPRTITARKTGMFLGRLIDEIRPDTLSFSSRRSQLTVAGDTGFDRIRFSFRMAPRSQA